MRILTDDEISSLISEPKIVAANWLSRLDLKDKTYFQHREKEIDIEGSNGNLFRIIIRQNKLNILDFSIILVLREKDSNLIYRLIRFNGKHPSQHTNKWEKENRQLNHKFEPAFHIHRATQRYQESGYDIDGYAEVTSSYSDLYSAFSQFLLECNIRQENQDQTSFI